MIATHSLAAFTPPVGRPQDVGPQGIHPVRGVTPAAPATSQAGSAQTDRTLGAVPAQPGRPLPRGSLLDLRV